MTAKHHAELLVVSINEYKNENVSLKRNGTVTRLYKTYFHK